MKMAPHPALANGKASHVGDAVAVVIAETLAQAQGRRRKGHGRLRGAARGRRSGQGGRERARRTSTRSRRTTRSISGIIGDPDAAEAAFKSAKHVTKLDIRQQPAGAERDGAARGARRIRCRQRQLDVVEHDAKSARRAPRHLRLCRHGARAQAARHRARCRRRLRLEDFHLSRRSRLRCGRRAARQPAGEMDGGALGELSSPMRMAAITSPMREMAFDADGKIIGLQVQDRSPISAPTCRPSRRRCRPISTRRCCRASTRSRKSIARSMRSTPTPCRLTPIAGAGRPEATFVVERLVEVGARELGTGSGRRCGSKNFVKTFPHQTPVIIAL